MLLKSQDYSTVNYEVNFLTEEDVIFGDRAIRSIKAEFDLIQLWQKMSNPFGYEARSVLDCFIALSLRKLLCDENSILLKICPSFRMPPLVGERFEVRGEQDDMMLVELHPDIHIKSMKEWIPLNVWLNQRIAWIDKDESNVPIVISEYFYKMLKKKLNNTCFCDLYAEKRGDDNKTVWILKNPSKDKEVVYRLLKSRGYYDLTIQRMIKEIADKYGAHLDDKRSVWVRMANSSTTIGISAISIFATQMIYSVTKQVGGMEDYYLISPNIEIS